MQGLLLLDKPQNVTSYRSVAVIKRLTGEKRVGHTGTLDPMATGVLPILLGRATVLSGFLLDAEKRYTATIRFGVETDTGDLDGTVTNRRPVCFSRADLEAVLTRFCGKQLQTPPMFSAIKKDGVRLYDLARKGETVAVAPREIEVFSLKLTEFSPDGATCVLDTVVSKGTYIRALARDIGNALGCGAALAGLRRTATSGFEIGQCVAQDALTNENIRDYLLPAETVVAHLPAVTVTERQATRFCNGGQLDLERLKAKDFTDGKIFRVRFDDCLLGLGCVQLQSGQLAVKCVLKE